jgi:hypothetical protein
MSSVRTGDLLVADQPRTKWRVGVAAIAAVLLASACAASGGGRDTAPEASDPGASASPSAGASATAAVQASESPSPSAFVVSTDAGVLPRSVSYGTLNWTVTDAAITNGDPKQYVTGVAGPPTETTSLIVDLEIRNDSPHIGFVTTTSRLVAELPDASVIPGKDLERPSAAPESTVESRYSFDVPAGTTFDGLVLRFEDPGREPSLDLPLAGAAPEVEADDVVDVNEPIALGIPGIEMEWTLDSLISGRDWPLPIGFKGGTRVAGARAETGHQWVGIVARVDVARCDCKGGVRDQAGWTRLLVDGAPYTASAAESSTPIMNTSTSSDVMLVFDIPADANEIVLQVGPLDEPDQQASIDLVPN